MQDAPALCVEPLRPALRDDFLAFFDHERGRAFADNPGWAACYCHYHQVAPAIDWQTLDGPANRAAMRARIDTGEMEGYLAYRGREVVGWLNAQPRHRIPHCFARIGVAAPAIDIPPHEAAVIVCFVVTPNHRRSGIARTLLDHALAHLGARGLRIVDAFPLREDRAASVAALYHGSLAMYVTAGFQPFGTDGDRVVMRKRLAGARG